MKELNKIQKEFIWRNKNPKIKHITLCNKYDNGGLKNVDISSKIISFRLTLKPRMPHMCGFLDYFSFSHFLTTSCRL